MNAGRLAQCDISSSVLTQYVRVSAGIPIESHAVGVVGGDYDESLRRVGHLESCGDRCVHLQRLCERLTCLVAMVTVIDQAPYRGEWGLIR